MASVSTWIFLLLALVPLARGLGAFLRCSRLAPLAAKEWQEEYTIRRCAAVAAASANLRSAARLIAAQQPAVLAQARAEAEALSAELAARYLPEPPRPDEDGVCWPQADGTLAASLHEEHSAGQPRDWPNWVARLFATAARETDGSH